MNKKGEAITAVVLILVVISLVGIIFIAARNITATSLYESQKKIEAISDIDLKIISVEFSGDNLLIIVQNTGQENITSFIVRITSAGSQIYFNDSVYLENKASLGPLNREDILIIPAPFGNLSSNYSLVEVIPKFDYNGEEAIAETAKASVKGNSIGGGSASNPVPQVKYECNDETDNDGDGLVDMDDSGCANAQDNDESDSNSCRTDFSEIDGNLVQNPNAECDNDNNNTPDNWVKYAESVAAGHILTWGSASSSSSKVLKSENTNQEYPNSFAWQQTIYNIEPGRWYEFSVSIANEGIEPRINTTTNEMLDSSTWGGVAALPYNSSNKFINWPGTIFWIRGVQFSGWDEDYWVYRTWERKGFENWRTMKSYFKMPINTHHVIIKTYNYPKGKIYADNFILRELSVNYNPDAGELKKSGTLNFVQYKGNDFFPIFAHGYPGRGITVSQLKNIGFNTVQAAAGYENEILQNSMAAAINEIYMNAPNNYWRDDPQKTAEYTGKAKLISTISAWKDFPNLLMIETRNEISSSYHRKGENIGNLLPSERINEYIRTNLPGIPIIQDFGSETGYTGYRNDSLNYYLALTDIVSYTENLPAAYPNPAGNFSSQVYLGRAGEKLRWTLKASQEAGVPKKVFAMGLGVPRWSSWDGYSGWHDNQYVPVNLQRFQVWNQIINGAVGAWFWGMGYSEADTRGNVYNEYNFRIIGRIATELSSLYDVLLEPQFYGEWSVSDERVEIMMKKHNGKIYLFAASNYYEDLRNIQITLDSEYNLISVKAVNDIINGNINSPVNRTVVINSDKHSFNDDFIGDYNATPGMLNSPGYAVHIYEIEYS